MRKALSIYLFVGTLILAVGLLGTGKSLPRGEQVAAAVLVL
jgi:hypothetical protein